MVKPGDDVTYRGRRARVVAIETVPTPSGGIVAIVRLLYPRGGEQYVFRAELEVESDREQRATGQAVRREDPGQFGRWDAPDRAAMRPDSRMGD